MIEVKGTGVFGGISIAKTHVLEVHDYNFKPEKAKDEKAEFKLFTEAKEKSMAELKELYNKALEELGEDHAAIFDVHQMMLDDEDFNEEISNKILMESYKANYSVKQVGDEFASLFASMDDEYMKARAADIKDITKRVVDNIMGYESATIKSDVPVIVIADDLAPSETVSMDKSKISAFVTRKGSANSHTAILARMMNIPSVVMADIKVNRKNHGIEAIVDGFTGMVYLNPTEEKIAEMTAKMNKDLERRERLEELKGKENITLDGTKVKVFANIGGPEDVESALHFDAGGVGLFRSEFLYLSRDHYPLEEQQFLAYKKVAEGLKGKNIVIRTLDIGADKQIGYFNLPIEENPAMGYRAIRICLDRIQVFKTQLRAIYRASAFGDISIMFPMIISVDEVLKIKEICKEVRDELRAESIAFDENLELGIMIETPAAVMISDLLAKEVDFFSVGTNDLTQYTLAIDRQNQMLESIYDSHHPAILRMLKILTDNAHKEGIWVGICGELAADTSLTEEFLRIGIDELSVAPPYILELREKIRSIDLSK